MARKDIRSSLRGAPSIRPRARVSQESPGATPPFSRTDTPAFKLGQSLSRISPRLRQMAFREARRDQEQAQTVAEATAERLGAEASMEKLNREIQKQAQKGNLPDYLIPFAQRNAAIRLGEQKMSAALVDLYYDEDTLQSMAGPVLSPEDQDERLDSLEAVLAAKRDEVLGELGEDPRLHTGALDAYDKKADAVRTRHREMLEANTKALQTENRSQAFSEAVRQFANLDIDQAGLNTFLKETYSKELPRSEVNKAIVNDGAAQVRTMLSNGEYTKAERVIEALEEFSPVKGARLGDVARFQNVFADLTYKVNSARRNAEDPIKFSQLRTQATARGKSLADTVALADFGGVVTPENEGSFRQKIGELIPEGTDPVQRGAIFQAAIDQFNHLVDRDEAEADVRVMAHLDRELNTLHPGWFDQADDLVEEALAAAIDGQVTKDFYLDYAAKVRKRKAFSDIISRDQLDNYRALATGTENSAGIKRGTNLMNEQGRAIYRRLSGDAQNAVEARAVQRFRVSVVQELLNRTDNPEEARTLVDQVAKENLAMLAEYMEDEAVSIINATGGPTRSGAMRPDQTLDFEDPEDAELLRAFGRRIPQTPNE